MPNIIELSGSGKRSREHPETPLSDMAAAEIIIFPGVRYERMDPEPAKEPVVR